MVKSRARFSVKENLKKAPAKLKKGPADGEDVLELEFENPSPSGFDNTSYNGITENTTPLKSDVSDMNFDTPSTNRRMMSEPKL